MSLSRERGGVRGVEAGDYVVIEVTDSGAGIPAAILVPIFDPFFSTKELGTGNGLGLSMVFGFAKQSHGSVEVDSEEGKGACASALDFAGAGRALGNGCGRRGAAGR